MRMSETKAAANGPRAVWARSSQVTARDGEIFERSARGRTCCGPRRPALRGYLLTELLVYIGLVVVVLGLAYGVMYRCVDNAVVLRRNVEDVAAAMRAGEMWRADVRRSEVPVALDSAEGAQGMRLGGRQGQVSYRFEANTVFRRLGEQPWVQLVSHVKSSTMQADPRAKITAWRWELELLPRTKGYNQPGRVRPLFTFIAVPEGKAQKP